MTLFATKGTAWLLLHVLLLLWISNVAATPLSSKPRLLKQRQSGTEEEPPAPIESPATFPTESVRPTTTESDVALTVNPTIPPTNILTSVSMCCSWDNATCGDTTPYCNLSKETCEENCTGSTTTADSIWIQVPPTITNTTTAPTTTSPSTSLPTASPSEPPTSTPTTAPTTDSTFMPSSFPAPSPGPTVLPTALPTTPSVVPTLSNPASTNATLFRVPLAEFQLQYSGKGGERIPTITEQYLADKMTFDYIVGVELFATESGRFLQEQNSTAFFFGNAIFGNLPSPPIFGNHPVPTREQVQESQAAALEDANALQQAFYDENVMVTLVGIAQLEPSISSSSSFANAGLLFASVTVAVVGVLVL